MQFRVSGFEFQTLLSTSMLSLSPHRLDKTVQQFANFQGSLFKALEVEVIHEVQVQRNRKLRFQLEQRPPGLTEKVSELAFCEPALPFGDV
jgi:hypothetical protein